MNGHVERATYTYAIARPFHPSHLWCVRGVDRTPVHLVHHGELVAVVGTLSFTEADEAALRARLETPAELEAIAQAHHAVVTSVFEHSVTLPFRLATIHQSEQRVVEMLRTGHERFRSALRSPLPAPAPPATARSRRRTPQHRRRGSPHRRHARSAVRRPPVPPSAGPSPVRRDRGKRPQCRLPHRWLVDRCLRRARQEPRGRPGRDDGRAHRTVAAVLVHRAGRPAVLGRRRRRALTSHVTGCLARRPSRPTAHGVR
jgi:hypothetical protein